MNDRRPSLSTRGGDVKPPPIALVTGAAGFLGSHMAARLARSGWHVLGIGNGLLSKDQQTAIGIRHWQAGSVQADSIDNLIRDHGTPELVVHAAGGASVRAAEENAEADRQRTVASTAALLDALRHRAPDTCLLLPSSAAVYGNDHDTPIVEAAAVTPISAYGRHKRQAEELCLEAATHGSLRLAIIRFFSLYGAGLRKQIFWDLWNKMGRGGTLILGGTGDETRDFMHIDDATRLLLHVAPHTSPKTPIIVNGGTGRATTIREATLLMERLCGSTAQLSFSGEARQGDPAHLVADVTRLEKLGYSHTVTLPDGLADYARWLNGDASPAASASDRRSGAL